MHVLIKFFCFYLMNLSLIGLICRVPVNDPKMDGGKKLSSFPISIKEEANKTFKGLDPNGTASLSLMVKVQLRHGRGLYKHIRANKPSSLGTFLCNHYITLFGFLVLLSFLLVGLFQKNLEERKKIVNSSF